MTQRENWFSRSRFTCWQQSLQSPCPSYPLLCSNSPDSAFKRWGAEMCECLDLLTEGCGSFFDLLCHIQWCFFNALLLKFVLNAMQTHLLHVKLYRGSWGNSAEPNWSVIPKCLGFDPMWNNEPGLIKELDLRSVCLGAGKRNAWCVV